MASIVWMVLSALGFLPLSQAPAPAWGGAGGGWAATAQSRLPGMEQGSSLNFFELPVRRTLINWL